MQVTEFRSKIKPNIKLAVDDKEFTVKEVIKFRFDDGSFYIKCFLSDDYVFADDINENIFLLVKEIKTTFQQPFPEEQKKALIADFNANNFPKPKFESAIQLFEVQVRKSAAKVAIEFGKKKITYGELNQKAGAIGDFLTAFLKKNQQKIYILADNGIGMIASFPGILKSGNILSPLNPKHPDEMMKEIFNEVKPDLIISQKKYLDILKKDAKNLPYLPVLIIDEPAKERFKKDNLEFINFGSIDHMREIIPVLCSGATLCIPENENLLLSSLDLVKWLEDNKITRVSFPGPFFKYFVEGLKNKSQSKNLKYILVSSDKLGNDK